MRRRCGYRPTPTQIPAATHTTFVVNSDDPVELCNTLKRAAESDANYQTRCILGEKVFFFPYDRALMPGHIYSEDGKAEFGISQFCEYHFDESFDDADV